MFPHTFHIENVALLVKWFNNNRLSHFVFVWVTNR
jgi:hypothetical protein